MVNMFCLIPRVGWYQTPLGHRVYFNGVQLANYTASGTVYNTGQSGIAVCTSASTANIFTFSGGLLALH